VDGLKAVTRSKLFGKGVYRHTMGTVSVALKIFFHFLEERGFCRRTVRKMCSLLLFLAYEGLS